MISKRLKALPPYLFAELDEMKERVIRGGSDVIDLSEGNPDKPTPSHVIDALCSAAYDPQNHGYPSYDGIQALKEAIADWYRSKNVSLNPDDEAVALIGTKEGIAHTPLAFLDANDVALIPDPGYPVYRNATILADGIPRAMPILPDNDFKPDLDLIDAKDAKLMFLNYPNNPTTAIADKDFFGKVVNFAEDKGIIVCHDFAHSEITYDGYEAPSFLSVKNAKELAVEFYSLSKTYNMAGWRIGFVVGNPDILEPIRKVKTNVDSGVFNPIQSAAIAALRSSQGCVNDIRKTYEERRNIMRDGLEALGLDVYSMATLFVWVKIPSDDSMAFCKRLLKEAGVVATPGVGFGKNGEGFVRFSLTEGSQKIKEAMKRMSKYL